MADYKELLRRAIQVLPENNGAARRAVYEKARSALVGQLRAIDPPLPAREITQHRLQLEDCIRQVEQEASEAVISGLNRHVEEPHAPPVVAKAPPPAEPVRAPEPEPEPEPAPVQVAQPEPEIEEADELPAPVEVPAPVLVAVEPQPEKPVERRSHDRRATDQHRDEPQSNGHWHEPRDQHATHDHAHSQDNTPQPPVAVVPPPVAAVPPPVRQEPVRQEPVRQEPARLEARRFEPAPASRPDVGSIEDIISQAEQATATPIAASAAPVPLVKPTIEARQNVERQPASEPGQEAEVLPLPSIVAGTDILGAEPAPAAPQKAPAPNRPLFKPFSIGLKAPKLEPRRDASAVVSPRVEPGIAAQGHAAQAAARQHVAEPLAIVEAEPVVAAMSSVREVDVEPMLANNGAVADSEAAIGRAIATLDREARGEVTPMLDAPANDFSPVQDPSPAAPPAKGKKAKKLLESNPLPDEEGFEPTRIERERGGGGAITIFLLVFVVLLAGVGGAGFWAWREGYIDFAAMFGQSEPQTEVIANATPGVETDPAVPTAEGPVELQGPGNTETTVNGAAPVGELKTDERLTSEPTATEPTAQPTGELKTEERLPTEDAAVAATDPAGTTAPLPDATATAGSQSLLLEASDDGTTGAVPFSGTVEWTQGTDETGQPTLVGKANIPARNLGVDVLIRRNTDPSLPASHLMEINFSVSQGFMGGSIAGLPGVLLKNEELVQGSPLVGASARVVGNSFLFALSAGQDDITTNSALLTDRKWMDLAIIYATGKRAILTLEKDPEAEALFKEVFAAWSSAPSPAAAATTDG